MQESNSELLPIQLLNLLEKEVFAKPLLKEEWDTSWVEFCGNTTASADKYLRFKEYFLLERESEVLGEPPVVAFDSAADSGDFQCLQDSFLGIFHLSEQIDEYSVKLVDLWSGGVVVCPAADSTWPGGDNSLAIGRFVLTESGFHIPLPGLSFISAPGLVASVERDLNAARALNPRARLSQQECESLFEQFSHTKRAKSEARSAGPSFMELISKEDYWDMNRVENILNNSGAEELLNQLAFDSNIDLAQARGALDEMFNQEEAEDVLRSDDQLDPKQVEAAINELKANELSGKSKAELIQELADKLGLGLIPEDEDLNSPRESFGPDQAAGLKIWLDAWIWESEANKLPLSAAQKDICEHFCSWTQRRFNTQVDASDIQQDWVIAWLCSFTSVQEHQNALTQSLAFLDWCEQEQGAPLNGLAASLEGDLGRRMQALVELNLELNLANGEGSNICALLGVNPFTVKAEKGESSLVVGVPSDRFSVLKSGDHLFGRWEAGKFVACAVIPQEAIPEAPPEQE